MKWLKRWVNRLETHISKPWYPWAIGLVFGLDHFILVLPLDGILITSLLAAPKRWISLFIAATVGFTLGAVAFALLVQIYGLSVVEKLSPGITTNPVWLRSEALMEHYGLFAVGGLSMIPLTLHPLVALAALQHVPLVLIGLSIFAGRVLRYGILAFLAAHAPRFLLRSKLIQKELGLAKDAPEITPKP